MTCCFEALIEVPGAFTGGGRGLGGTMEVLTLTITADKGRPPADAIFPHDGCRPQPVPS